VWLAQNLPDEQREGRLARVSIRAAWQRHIHWWLLGGGALVAFVGTGLSYWAAKLPVEQAGATNTGALFGTFLTNLGTAGAVAGIFAMLFEWQFIRDLVKNVVPAALEHTLPDQLKGTALWLFQQDLLCVDCWIHIRLMPRPEGHLLVEGTSIRMIRNLSTRTVEVPMNFGVDDCLPDAPGPRLLEFSSTIEGDPTSLVHHFPEGGQGFKPDGRLQYVADLGTRALAQDKQIRIVVRWQEVKRLEDCLLQTHRAATYRPRVHITTDEALPLDMRVQMSSHIESLQQGVLYELPFTLLPYQPVVVRWRLKPGQLPEPASNS